VKVMWVSGGLTNRWCKGKRCTTMSSHVEMILPVGEGCAKRGKTVVV